MKESEQRHLTLKINASEETSLMELYTNTLNVTAATDLLDVLIAADKFGVSSCMRSCMTPESALLYLELPHVLMADVVQPLADAAKTYLVGRYKDILKFQEEIMTLPLCGLLAILASDLLLVITEDVVYDFVLMWVRQHYDRHEERQQVLDTRLARLIRFPYMTCSKLEEALTCNDFKFRAFKLVLKTIIFKARPLHRQQLMRAKVSASLDSSRFVERACKYRPIKVIEFEHPQQHCVVYLDMKRDECANLFPFGLVCSQSFHLGGQEFSLSAQCMIMGQPGSFHCIGLRLGMLSSPVSFVVDYEFAVRSRPTEEFVSKFKRQLYIYSKEEGF